VASALTPEFRDRFDLVRGVLPPGGIAAARVSALAFGLALIWLSRSLAHRRRRAWQLAVAVVVASAVAHLAKGLDFEEALISLAHRRRRAWQLAVAVVVASAVAHLAKGLDFEEALISLALLLALVRYRSRFDAPGDRASNRPLLALVAAIAAGGAFVLGVELH